MGAWGTGLYYDDVAADVRDVLKDQLRSGRTVEDITQELIRRFEIGQSEYDDDEPVFWCALADTQWSLGRLLPEVKEKALEWIEKGGDVYRWEEIGPEFVKSRKKVFEKLKQKLPPPAYYNIYALDRIF